MKRSISYMVFLAVITLFPRVSLGDVPKGFENPELLSKVMNGDIVLEEVLDTELEFGGYVRSYFNKVSPQTYVDLATNHIEWPSLLAEIKEGKTTKINADRTEFDSWLYLVVKYLFFNYDFYPEGNQKIVMASDAVSETMIYSMITNYQEDIKSGEMTTRLIPHETGILVEDSIYVLLQEENIYSNVIKNEFKKKYVVFVENFRNALQGNY